MRRYLIQLGLLFAAACFGVAQSHRSEQALAMQRVQPELTARILARRPLRYREGQDEALDRPPYVRAASGLAWVGPRLAVVQDDASFIALVDPQTGLADAVALPADSAGRRVFDEARGTKHLKLDLESCFARSVADGTVLVALGSGSLPKREHIVSLSLDAEARVRSLRVVDAHTLYARLREQVAFSGSELNLEGVVLRGDTLMLFQRGNGAPARGLTPVNAVGELDLAALERYLAGSAPPPALRAIRAVDLGGVAGVPYTFTDATLTPSGRVLFVASAEDSPDAVADGMQHGTLLGELLEDGRVRTTPLLDERGAPTRLKAEGLVIDRLDDSRAWLVVDADDPSVAAELLEARLGGV